MELNMENYKHYVNLFNKNDNMDVSIHESEGQHIRQLTIMGTLPCCALEAQITPPPLFFPYNSNSCRGL